MSNVRQDYFETIDGSVPHATALPHADGEALPLSAFTVLVGGDVFEAVGRKPPADGAKLARNYLRQCTSLKAHGASKAHRELVVANLVRQLCSNTQLIERLMRAKPLQVDLIPPGVPMARYGYPRVVAPQAAGLYWDHPDWPTGRMALRQDCLDSESVLAFHEMAHAIHYLAFTEHERKLIYDVLRPTFGTKAAMDEAFAIYSEREFVAGFSDAHKKVMGVYGFTRRQWNEDHLFTRFVRKLYAPHKPAAGPGVR